MPKRKSEEKLAYYLEKIKKIQDKETKTRRRVRVILSDSSDSEDKTSTAPLSCNYDLPELVEDMVSDEQGQGQVTEESPLADIESPQESIIVPQSSVDSGEMLNSGTELDPELLQALGAKTSDDPEYGDKIHDNLSQLWVPLLKKGMSKEDKEAILKQYLIPHNCTLLQAPKLNLEISAALTDAARNKDKKLLAHQQQLGHGITAINRAMDLLLNKDGDGRLNAIKHLSNATRILCDLHHINSQVRVKLITPSLDKSFLNVVQDSLRDDTLFGDKLSEKIKSSKAIEKQGLQIKKSTPAFSAPSTSTSRPAQSRGNWTAPPRYTTNKMSRGGHKRPPLMRKPPPSAHPPPQTRQATKLQQARAPPQH